MKTKYCFCRPALGLCAALLLAVPVLATPVTMDADATTGRKHPATSQRQPQEAPATPPTGFGRSADLGLSTALPLGRHDDVLWSGGYADAQVQQSFVVEPGTLALVGLGLIAFGISRRLKSRREDR